MLQINCPDCKGVIKSPFLTDVKNIECGQCKNIIPVKDIFITTKSFTMHREDFLNRTFRFQKLLREVEKELLLMSRDKNVSTKSLESLEKFHSSLQELLSGARNNYRMEIPCNLYAEVNHCNRTNKGKLLNLSMAGASIELIGSDIVPRKKSGVDIVLSFPEQSEHLHTNAKVVWTKELVNDDGPQSAIIGVNFINTDEHTRSCIWNYILDNAPVPLQRLSR
jgi:hypothetical protein